MAMFAMEISFLFALAVFAGGLVLLHHGRQPGASLVRAAALVLLIGSVLSAAGTLYAGIRYHVQGQLGSAYPMFAQGWMHGGCGGPGEGWMRRHPIMGPGMMGRMPWMMGAPPPPAPEPTPEPEKAPKKP